LRCLTLIALIITSSCFAQKSKLKIEFIVKDTTGTIQADVLKFYVSDLKVLFHDVVEQDAPQNHYLINFEENSTTIEIEDLKGKLIRGLDLCIGTDSLVNVSGAFDGDLDPIHGMYWTWNSGYINIKLEGLFESKPFEYHIGGYSGERRTLRRKFLLQDDPKERRLKVELDLNAFFKTIDPHEDMKMMLPGQEAAELATSFIESIELAK
jgi:hypothetical protein